MSARHDLVIVGGGPAGLAVAIAAASRGLDALVLERRPGPPDKACGEGLLPRGVEALRSLGALPLVNARGSYPLRAIRYVQGGGAYVEGALAPPGLGVRRLVLAEALAERAGRAGATVVFGRRALGWTRDRHGVVVQTDAGPVLGALLVAADGLHSPIRRDAGLQGAPSGAPARFGVRRHFRTAPWGARVEVHLAEGSEAYVTPVDRDQVGVAILWEPERAPGGASYERLLAQFPELRARLRGAPAITNAVGAGPFAQSARTCVADRLVLVGDAAGYVDAITGEGVSMALECAEILGRTLPEVLREGATAHALRPYERAYRRRYRRYALVTHAVLSLLRHPRLRERVVRGLAGRPTLFSEVVRWGVGPLSSALSPARGGRGLRLR